jgi:hypothetical protein
LVPTLDHELDEWWDRPIEPNFTTYNSPLAVGTEEMVDRAELRQQFLAAFEGADYPVDGPMDLLPALPNGPATTFESGAFSATAMDLYTQGGDSQDFPYESVEDLVDDVMAGLEAEGYL